MERDTEQAERDVYGLGDVHRLELEILLEFQRVCTAHGLSFYLTGGSLLGAARHHGFIPWDDDIDVAMPRADYERFAQLCAGQALSPGYCYQNARVTPGFPHFFAKLRKQGPDADGYIDIFPLDKCPDRDGLAILFFKGVEVVNTAVFTRLDQEFVCGYTKWYMRFLWRLLRRLPTGVLFALRDGLRRLFGLAASGKLICNVGGMYGFPGEVCRIEWFSQRAELEFEGHRFPVPCGWHEMLTNMYGDYMTLPPEAERHGHVKEGQKKEV